MYDILNINEDKPTAQQTWNNLYNIQEKDWKKIYTLNNTYKCAHINGLISSLILVRSFSNFNKYKRHVCYKIAFILFRIK